MNDKDRRTWESKLITIHELFSAMLGTSAKTLSLIPGLDLCFRRLQVLRLLSLPNNGFIDEPNPAKAPSHSCWHTCSFVGHPYEREPCKKESCIMFFRCQLHSTTYRRFHRNRWRYRYNFICGRVTQYHGELCIECRIKVHSTGHCLCGVAVIEETHIICYVC